ncbi:MAG TPA: hypothetical protein VE082_08655, partial [Desulfobaccales bacterium]|nr:hypothetical protein [Desulfobaccales bacterium]
MYWDVNLETLSPEALQDLQLQRLRQTVETAARSPFYGRRLQEAGVTDADLRTPDDIRRIPLTTKDDLRAHNREMLTRPLADMVRVHASSGTSGQATVIYYTRKDVETWADLVARSLYMTGMRPADVFQNMMGYGLFTGGLGLHYGAERLGALIIPAGAVHFRQTVGIVALKAVGVLQATAHIFRVRFGPQKGQAQRQFPGVQA